MSNDSKDFVTARRDDIETAREMRARGASLFEISVAVGRSKEWLRTYAGLSENSRPTRLAR